MEIFKICKLFLLPNLDWALRLLPTKVPLYWEVNFLISFLSGN